MTGLSQLLFLLDLKKVPIEVLTKDLESLYERLKNHLRLTRICLLEPDTIKSSGIPEVVSHFDPISSQPAVNSLESPNLTSLQSTLCFSTGLPMTGKNTIFLLDYSVSYTTLVLGVGSLIVDSYLSLKKLDSPPSNTGSFALLTFSFLWHLNPLLSLICQIILHEFFTLKNQSNVQRACIRYNNCMNDNKHLLVQVELEYPQRVYISGIRLFTSYPTFFS